MLSTLASCDISLRLHDQVAHQVVDHAPDGLVELSPRGAPPDTPRRPRVEPREDAHFAQLLELIRPGAHAVVDVVVVVGDLVGEVGDLRLEPGLRSLEEALADVAQLARVLRPSSA